MMTTEDDRLLHIRYTSPLHTITVENGHLCHKVIREKYDHPTSTLPSSREVERVAEGDLSATQLADLVTFIEGSGFDRLMDTYGAPEGMRCYPHVLFVELGQLRKTVTYRSSPHYEQAPEAFQAIERYLLRLAPEGGPAKTLSIHYKNWVDDIRLEDRHIHHVVTHYVYDNPVSGIPSSWENQVVLDADLTDLEWTALSQFISHSTFDQLANRYGAPEGERAYPYTLTIRQGEMKKTVAYYHNPAYEVAPEAFREIEEYVTNLSHKVRERLPYGEPQPALR